MHRVYLQEEVRGVETHSQTYTHTSITNSRPPSPSIFDDYEIKGKIADGGCSVVKSCNLKSSQEEFAVKIISKKDYKIPTALIENEIKILRQCDHPNVLKLETVFEDENHFHIVMELVNGGDLFSRVIGKQALTESEAHHIFVQLLEAVKHLHSKNIVHRDIKLENILLQDGNTVKLSDFGFSKIIQSGDEHFMKTTCGTPSYIAPEMLMAESYSCTVDIWALGITLFLMIFGDYPFKSDGNVSVYEKIISGVFEFPENTVSTTSTSTATTSATATSTSDDLKDLISGLLKKDISQRLTLEEIFDHPWITKQKQEDQKDQKEQQQQQGHCQCRLILQEAKAES